jgi:hypothetical protein
VVVLVDVFSGSVPGANVALSLLAIVYYGDVDEKVIPSREEAMMQSSWKPSQQIGSDPTILDYGKVSMMETMILGLMYHDRWQ